MAGLLRVTTALADTVEVPKWKSGIREVDAGLLGCCRTADQET
jgi:hypothetical protein